MNEWGLVFRLVIACLLGALIGLEREFRAKEAGIRTHVLVCLGSAVFMVVSQWGFGELLKASLPGDVRLDPSRVASQVASGIGFIGAGTIMMHKQFVRGLTTASGMWAAAGIGLAAGAGMYTVAAAATALVLISLELLIILTRNIHRKTTHMVIVVPERGMLARITNELSLNDIRIISLETSSPKSMPEHVKVELYVRELCRDDDETHLVEFMNRFDGVVVEKVE